MADIYFDKSHMAFPDRWKKVDATLRQPGKLEEVNAKGTLDTNGDKIPEFIKQESIVGSKTTYFSISNQGDSYQAFNPNKQGVGVIDVASNDLYVSSRGFHETLDDVNERTRSNSRAQAYRSNREDQILKQLEVALGISSSPTGNTPSAKTDKP